MAYFAFLGGVRGHAAASEANDEEEDDLEDEEKCDSS